jgi:hypothetical protein
LWRKAQSQASSDAKQPPKPFFRKKSPVNLCTKSFTDLAGFRGGGSLKTTFDLQVIVADRPSDWKNDFAGDAIES